MNAELSPAPKDAVILTLLVAWLVLSIIAQLRRSLGGVTRWGSLGGLVPVHRLFAPRPVVHDHAITHRCVHRDGSSTPWRPVVVPARSPFCWIWNPRLRLANAISATVAQLCRELPRPLEAVRRSDPYRVILQHVMYLERSECGGAVQFAITRSTGFEEGETDAVLFVSEVHPVDRAAIGTAGTRDR